MAAPGRISELTSIIASRTTAIQSHLESQNLPSPSFSINSPPALPLPPHLKVCQTEIWNASTELQALIVGPLDYLTRITNPACNIFISLEAIHKFKIALNLRLEEEISFEEIARRCNLDVSDAQRILRLAISCHIFQEPRKGMITHSAASKLLLQLPLLHQWIGVVCEEMLPSAVKAVEAIGRWPGSQEPNETGFALANGAGQSFWDSLGSGPERAQRFSDAMLFLQSGPAFDPEHLFKDLDWNPESCPKVLVDVGGSQGSIAIELLRKFPGIERCIVEDIPDVIGNTEVSQDLDGRLIFRGHNIFTEQPVRDADIFLLRSILHDWSDKYALQILRNLRPALQHNTKIIINEVCLPEPGEASFYEEQVLRGYDLAMKHTFNSKERDRGEWKELLSSADNRFELRDIRRSQGSFLSVLEVVWTDERHEVEEQGGPTACRDNCGET